MIDGRPPVPRAISDMEKLSPRGAYYLTDTEFGKPEPLIEAYNARPTSIGGVITHDTSDPDGQPICTFNGSLSDMIGRVTAAKRPSNEGPGLGSMLTGNDTIQIQPRSTRVGDGRARLTERQRGVLGRLPLRRYLARLGMSASVVCTAIAAEVTNIEINTAPGGIALVGTAYVGMFAIISLAEGRFSTPHAQKRAARTINNFGNYVSQPEHGAVVFARGKYGLRRHEVAATQQEAKRASRLGLYLEHASNDSEVAAPKVSVAPIDLIKTLLKADPLPVELWQAGLGEHAQKLSEAERIVLGCQRTINGVLECERFTGVPDDDKDKVNKELQQAQRALLGAALDMVQFSQEHTRVKLANRHIDQVTTGKSEAPHPLEMHLQVLYGEAAHALASLNVQDYGSDGVAQAMAKYLEGARKLLTDPGQMQQFYQGLVVQFADKLPGYKWPDWDTVAGKLPVFPLARA